MAKKPHEIRRGRIKATIWENESQNGNRVYNTKFSRLYKPDAESDWAESDSFGRDELLLLARVATLAHDWIFEQKRDGE